MTGARTHRTRAGRTENVYPVLFEGYDSLIAEYGGQGGDGTLVNRVNAWSGSRVDDLTLSCARYRLPIIAAP